MVVDTKELLTTREAAKLLGLARCTIYRWLSRGWIVGITLPNGTIKIPKSSINKLLDGR